MTEGIRISQDQAEWFAHVLEDAGATPQEWARFTHLLKRSATGAFVAATLIEGGALTVAEAIDGCAEVHRELGR